ncbi:hypothetical protein B0T16DRAFT_322235, partial [Cercophora newfieldiana]
QPQRYTLLPFTNLSPYLLTPSPTVWTFTPTVHNDTYHLINPDTTTSLMGKSVLITAANKGIGCAAAISYARAGATPLILTSRTPNATAPTASLAAAASANRPPSTILQTTLDVTSPASLTSCLSEIRAAIIDLHVPHLDILINNAGFMGPEATLLDQDEDEYLATVDVNFTGTYRVTRAFLPMMLVQGGMKTVVFLRNGRRGGGAVLRGV